MKEKDFNHYLERFIQYRLRRNYSKGYIAHTRYYLNKFFDYLQSHTDIKDDIRAVTKPVILDYWQYLKGWRNKEGKGYSDSNIHGCIKMLRQFFRYLKRRDLILADPTEGLPVIRDPKRIPKGIMTKHQVDNILSRPDLDKRIGFRDRTILEVLYSTGIRREELTRLTIYDIDTSAGLVRVNQGKGKKDRVVPIGKIAVEFVKEYLQNVRPKLQKDTSIKSLFLTWTGRTIHPNAVTIMVKKYCRQANIKETIGAHGFRHTCATEMLRGGCSVSHVQAMLGHAHIKTTQIYTRVVPLDLKKVYEKTHPRQRQKNKEIISFNNTGKIRYKPTYKHKNKRKRIT